MNIIKDLNKKECCNKGITLIALVITIIVLLILAGISIAMLTGDNGILNKATTAKEETTKASAEEKVKIAVYGSYNENGKIDVDELNENLENVEGIDKSTTDIKKLPATVICDGYEVEITGTLDGQLLEIGEIVTGTNQKYTNNGTAVIPVGFAIVPGFDNVSEGLVISDVENDTENQGNQFVWIPVTDINKFILKDGYENNSLQTEVKEGKCKEPCEEGGYDTEKAEYDKMYNSVKNNQGFYIGRYEAGKDNDGKVVSKKNTVPYFNIKWGNSMTDSTGGAVELARNFAKENEYTNVTSTLCYGVQWDATMQFMDNNYINGTCDENSYVRNSTGKGYYGHIAQKINTGSNEEYQMKNIYDMGGNVLEWTMETYNNKNRVYRGGYSDASGLEYPASNRYYNSPTYYIAAIGFRITLYVQ